MLTSAQPHILVAYNNYSISDSRAGRPVQDGAAETEGNAQQTGYCLGWKFQRLGCIYTPSYTLRQKGEEAGCSFRQLSQGHH